MTVLQKHPQEYDHRRGRTWRRLAIFSAIAMSVLMCSRVSAQTFAECQMITFDKSEAAISDIKILPAQDFLSSLYDDSRDIQSDIKAQSIRGIMCTRDNPIPSLRDFPIIATGLPLSLTQNPEAPGGGTVRVYYADGRFSHTYAGFKFSKADKARLADILDIYNLQSHNLEK